MALQDVYNQFCRISQELRDDAHDGLDGIRQDRHLCRLEYRLIHDQCTCPRDIETKIRYLLHTAAIDPGYIQIRALETLAAGYRRFHPLAD